MNTGSTERDQTIQEMNTGSQRERTYMSGVNTRLT
jgi:hypothetical protein